MPVYRVDLPAGGSLELDSPDEVQLWNTSAKRFIDDYGLSKTNDLVLLGAILSQQLAMYRAQRALNEPKQAASAQNTIKKAAEEIRELEKALGIDKKSREAGGKHDMAAYVTTLKRAAHEKGVHVTARVKAYEHLAMELRWRVRLLRNGDAEDRAYHGISERGIIDWLEQQLAELEEKDKQWAKDKGRLFLGRL